MNFEFFSISALPYPYDALEPYIDARTMELHYTKHHQGYVDNLNRAIAGSDLSIIDPGKRGRLLLDALIRKIGSYSVVVRNHGGGHFNHSFFWEMLTAHTIPQPTGALLQALEQSFGSFLAFQQAFTAAAAGHFGSGWAWLSVARQDGRLMISSTANQDNPLMDVLPVAEQGIPILGLDLWEHAYYLRYQNRRLSYIEAFWNIIDWKVVEDRFETCY